MATIDRSGKLNVRLPAELHTELASEAERQGVSLNTLIVALLAGGIGWKAAKKAIMLAITLLALLAGPASATTLVNDPAHPFPAATFTQMQRWLAASHMPTPSISITVSNAPCPVAGPAACSRPGQIWFGLLNRMLFFHEQGRQVNFRLSAPARVALDAQFHAPYWDDSASNYQNPRAGENQSSDAYAECALRSRWTPWWRTSARIHDSGHGTIAGGGTIDDSTIYDFRAGPRHFARVCSIYRDVIA